KVQVLAAPGQHGARRYEVGTLGGEPVSQRGIVEVEDDKLRDSAGDDAEAAIRRAAEPARDLLRVGAAALVRRPRDGGDLALLGARLAPQRHDRPAQMQVAGGGFG